MRCTQNEAIDQLVRGTQVGAEKMDRRAYISGLYTQNQNSSDEALWA
jgi:hypothetical protein